MVNIRRSFEATDLFSVLPLVSAHCQCSLQVIACLARCSRQLKHACCTVTQRDAMGLLMSTLHDASATAVDVTVVEPSVQQQKQQQQYGEAVKWLLRTAPALMAEPGIAERLRQTPAVPLGCALPLVAAGVRISFSQLLAAANSMVAGVEVWVQAQQQLHIQTDIPEGAVAVCYEGDVMNVFWFPTPRLRIFELAQVAMNCTSHFVAAAAAALAQHSLPRFEPSVVRKLLLTAVTRQHTGAVQFMTGSKAAGAVLQHVDAPLLEAVLKCLVTALSGNEHCVDLLLHLPAAEQLGSAAVAELLQAAAQRRAHLWVGVLCKLPVAQRLSSADVAQLLQAAVPVQQQGVGNAMCVRHLCSLPGAAQLSTDVVRGLILAAVEHGGGVKSTSTEPLCKLPAAQQLSRGELTSLFQAALALHGACSSLVFDLCGVPGAAQVIPSVV